MAFRRGAGNRASGLAGAHKRLEWGILIPVGPEPMDIRLVIFVALTFLVLAWNAVLLWFIWRALARARGRTALRAAESARVKAAIRNTAVTAERVSSRMAAVSGQIRSAVEDLDEGLGRADNWARYGLAKFDFNVDRASGQLSAKTQEIGNKVRDPLFRTAVAIHGVRAVLDLIVRWKPGARRIERAARVMDPLDSLVTVVQTVTALGSLFTGGRSSRDRVPGTTSQD